MDTKPMYRFARRNARMNQNAIREILKVVSRPGMVSLAGGIPSPDSFPMGIMKDLTNRVIDTYSSGAFQYDFTEGFPPLREALTEYVKKWGIRASSEDIVVFSGSQGALDALGKIFISEGDCVAVESPTYLGAISAFNAYEPRYCSIETDEDGIIPESLDQILAAQSVKLVYLVPTFQNPTGRTLSAERRKLVADLLKKYNTVLVEDDPYSALRFSGKPLPPIKIYAPEHVIYVSTLSKTFAPGLRIGFAIAPDAVKKKLVTAKQGIDLHTSTFNQALAAEYLTGGFLDEQLPKIRKLYKPKRDAMLKALETFHPKGCSWSKPDGGMFLWVEGPEGLPMDLVYEKAISRNVAFVPGKYFFTNENEGLETMRLNYTMRDEETLFQAVGVLSEIIDMQVEGNSTNRFDVTIHSLPDFGSGIKHADAHR